MLVRGRRATVGLPRRWPACEFSGMASWAYAYGGLSFPDAARQIEMPKVDLLGLLGHFNEPQWPPSSTNDIPAIS